MLLPHFKIPFIVVAGGVGIATTVNAETVVFPGNVIDDFTTAPFAVGPVTFSGANAIEQQTSPIPEVLGSRREIRLSGAGTTLDGNTAAGLLQGSSPSGGAANIEYIKQLGPFFDVVKNPSGDPFTAFALNFTNVVGELNATISLNSPDGSSSAGPTRSVTREITVAETVSFDYSEFGGIDFKNLSEINLLFEFEESSSFALDSFVRFLEVEQPGNPVEPETPTDPGEPMLPGGEPMPEPPGPVDPTQGMDPDSPTLPGTPGTPNGGSGTPGGPEVIPTPAAAVAGLALLGGLGLRRRRNG